MMTPGPCQRHVSVLRCNKICIYLYPFSFHGNLLSTKATHDRTREEAP